MIPIKFNRSHKVFRKILQEKQQISAQDTNRPRSQFSKQSTVRGMGIPIVHYQDKRGTSTLISSPKRRREFALQAIRSWLSIRARSKSLQSTDEVAKANVYQQRVSLLIDDHAA